MLFCVCVSVHLSGLSFFNLRQDPGWRMASAMKLLGMSDLKALPKHLSHLTGLVATRRGIPSLLGMLVVLRRLQEILWLNVICIYIYMCVCVRTIKSFLGGLLKLLNVYRKMGCCQMKYLETVPSVPSCYCYLVL